MMVDIVLALDHHAIRGSITSAEWAAFVGLLLESGLWDKWRCEGMEWEYSEEDKAFAVDISPETLANLERDIVGFLRTRRDDCGSGANWPLEDTDALMALWEAESILP